MLHHIVIDPAWNAQRHIQTASAWQLHSSTCCDIVFATHSSAEGQRGILLCCIEELRQQVWLAKHSAVKLIPYGTSLLCIGLTTLHYHSLLASSLVGSTSLSTHWLSLDRDIILSGQAHIDFLHVGSSKQTIVYHLAHALASRDRADEWQC